MKIKAQKSQHPGCKDSTDSRVKRMGQARSRKKEPREIQRMQTCLCSSSFPPKTVTFRQSNWTKIVCLHDSPVHVQAGVHNGAAVADPSVVDEHVHIAKALQDLRSGPHYGPRVREVKGHRVRLVSLHLGEDRSQTQLQSDGRGSHRPCFSALGGPGREGTGHNTSPLKDVTWRSLPTLSHLAWAAFLLNCL